MEESRKHVDWVKYGLSETSEYKSATNWEPEYVYQRPEKNEEVKELFVYEQEQQTNEEEQEPWWKSNFFVTKKLLFGTWDGVFTSCVMNMVGVVVFLRSGWMVGYAGIGLSLLVVIISFLLTFATVISAVGICGRCHIEKGGVYFIIKHVLGGKIGGTIGLLYIIGHAISTSLYCTGFSESLCELANWRDAWAVRIVSIVTLFVMLSIAISGVKWIVRFQLLLIAILTLAVADFVIGTMVQNKPEAGFTGFSRYNFLTNLNNKFTDEVTFFVVLGVFFPSACGVMAGINMSGDLKNPNVNIPDGSVAGLGTCGFLYTLIVLLLGSTCTRSALQTDYMIMEKVSIVGALVLFGLFVAALSSTLGGLVGPPRVLQCIAEDDVLTILQPFARFKGANQEPINATLLVAFVAFVFVFVGKVNTLAPIVTMPFLMTYATINYGYFAMAQSYDLQSKEENININKLNKMKSSYGTIQQGIHTTPPVDIKSTSQNVDLAVSEEDVEEEQPKQTLQNDKELHTDIERVLDAVAEEAQDANNKDTEPLFKNKKKTNVILKREDSSGGYQEIEWIHKKETNGLFARFCNRWISLAACICCVLISFCISWLFALSNLVVTLLLYIFISHSRPGLSRGVSTDFNLHTWIVELFKRKKKSVGFKEHLIVQHHVVPYGISMYQVTDINSDYDHRDQKHHTAPVTNSMPY